MPYLIFYRIRRLNYRFQQIRHVFFIQSGVLNIFFYKKKYIFLRVNFGGHTISIPSNSFPDPAVWKKYILANGESLYPHL